VIAVADSSPLIILAKLAGIALPLLDFTDISAIHPNRPAISACVQPLLFAQIAQPVPEPDADIDTFHSRIVS
jgi:hypothetical protein